MSTLLSASPQSVEEKFNRLTSILERHLPPPSQATPSHSGTIAVIKECVARRAGISVDRLLCQRRQAELAHARHIAMYLSCELTNASLPHIAREFKKKDHTTVMYARNQVKTRIEEDETYAREVADTRAIIEQVLQEARDADLSDGMLAHLMQMKPTKAAV